VLGEVDVGIPGVELLGGTPFGGCDCLLAGLQSESRERPGRGEEEEERRATITGRLDGAGCSEGPEG
jgi:hypothetical protein